MAKIGVGAGFRLERWRFVMATLEYPLQGIHGSNILIRRHLLTNRSETVNKQVWLVLIVIGLLYVAQMDHQAIAAEPTTQEYLHSNCLIVSGDSGGPLFDFEGKLIGILDLSIGPELRHPGVWADISRILDGETFLTDHDNDEAVQLGFTNGQRVAADTQRHLSNQLCAELLAPARRATVEILVDGKATIFGTIVDTDGLVLTKRSEIMTHHGSLLGKLTCRLFNGEEVSAKVISDSREDDVALLQQRPPAAANAPSPSTSGQSFGPVVERVINHSEDSTSNYFLDLDAGRLVQAPDDIYNRLRYRFDSAARSVMPDEPIKNWAQTSGADLTPAFTSPDVTLILYGGMVVFPTLSFAEADAEQVRKTVNEAAQQRKKSGKPVLPLTMFHRPERDHDGAFVFQTHDGGIGLLQIVGSTEKPRSVTVRYKLLIGGTNDASLMMEGRSDEVENDAKGTKAAAVTNTFSLRHVLASKMAKDLRQILHGRPGHEAVHSADNRKIIVTAPPKVMERVRSIIVTTDWPDAIERGPDHQYSPLTVTRAARSFFYACAIEDSEEAISNLLSLQVLAQLKGETKSKQFEDFQRGGAANAEWEALLRADWPGKKELIQRLVRGGTAIRSNVSSRMALSRIASG